MMIFTVAPLLALYVYWRAVRPNAEGAIRVAGALLLALGALFPIFVDTFGGSILAPTLDARVMLVGEFFLLTLLASAIFVFFRDAVLVVCRFFSLRPACLTASKAIGLLFVSAALISGFSISRALRDPVVNHVTVAVENLPEDLAGLKIAQLSDLHQANVFGPERLKRIVRLTNALNADLIVITGDSVDGAVKSRGDDLLALKDLRAPGGVYVIEGNHEHYVDYDGWMAFYPTLGLKLLRNEHAVIKRGESAVVLAGLTDYGAGRFQREEPDMARALKGAPAGLTIVLSHQPREVKKLADFDVDLVLCGHTHGGQMPLLSILVTVLNDGLLRGLYMRKGNTGKPVSVYVHSGTGLWTGYSARLGTQNEIALITLEKKGK